MKIWGIYPIGVAILAALIFLASLDLLLALAALGVAIGLAGLVVLGPERLGTLFMLGAMALAPLDEVRPSQAVSVVTFSDFFLSVGFFLLIPTLLQRRSVYPFSFIVAAAALLVSLVVASLLSPDPVVAVTTGSRLVVAAILIPLAFFMWCPTGPVIDRLAWAYVLGQLISTGYALVDGPLANDRYDGLSTHVNFFGHAGLVAVCLLLFLYHRVRPSRRWLVWLCGAASLASIAMSGSRAAALTAAMVVILYPAMERSLVSAYLLISGGLVSLAVGSFVLDRYGAPAFLDRFAGNTGTESSDASRSQAIEKAISAFLEKPVQGHGFGADGLWAHNNYLQVAVAVGVFGSAAFLYILFTAVRPLLGRGPLRRLGYVGIGFVGIGLVTNSLWDRFVWLPMSLALLAAAIQSAPNRATGPTAHTPARLARSPSRNGAQNGVEPLRGPLHREVAFRKLP